MTAVDGLAPAVAAFCDGRLPAAAFQAALERATLFVERVEGPSGAAAVAAVGEPGSGAVCLYTSLAELAAHAGECDWASAPGADLLDLVPEGYGVVVDPAGPFTVALPASALSRGVVMSRSWGAWS